MCVNEERSLSTNLWSLGYCARVPQLTVSLVNRGLRGMVSIRSLLALSHPRIIITPAVK